MDNIIYPLHQIQDHNTTQSLVDHLNAINIFCVSPDQIPTKANESDIAYDLKAYIHVTSQSSLNIYSCIENLDKTVDIILNGKPVDKLALSKELEGRAFVALAPLKLRMDLLNDYSYQLLSNLTNRARVGTGVHLQLGSYANKQKHTLIKADVRPRSGWADKYGLSITNSPGLVDEGYTGEILVLLENRGAGVHFITSGARIAQLEINEVITTKLINRTDLNLEQFKALGERGDKGFGSTGYGN